MIVCAESFNPQPTNIQHPATLEVVSILVDTQRYNQVCVVAVYRRPQLALGNFLHLLDDYLDHCLQLRVPTVVLGDFNENLLVESSSSTTLVQFMSGIGFTQLVTTPTTDSRSLLDHIYWNHPSESCVVDVVDIYYSDHDGTFLSIPLV